MFFLEIWAVVSGKTQSLEAMIDSGAMGKGYIDRNFAAEKGFPTQKLDSTIKVNSVDGTACGSGIISEKVELDIHFQNVVGSIELLVIDCPSTPVILGLEWLKQHNPVINWKTGKVDFVNCNKGPTIEIEEGVPLRQVSSINLIEKYKNELMEQYADVFSDKEFPELPDHRPGIDLDLELVEDSAPPFGPIYSLSRDEEKSLREYIEKASAAGLIQESKSPAGSPVMFVKKPDGSLRLCVDYRALNRVTKTNRAALPIIRDMLRKAGGSGYFSKIDLKSAFHLIRIKSGKEYLTAFRTKYGHYEYLVMPFGLKNAPGTFQAFMNQIFGNLIDKGILVYIDDILIYTKNLDDHVRILQEVFKRIKKHCLIVKMEKCFFFQSEVTFLGHTLSSEGIGMDPGKLKSIEEWTFPRNKKEMRSFMGLANYYREFISGFSSLSKPLTDLTKDSVSWSVDEKAMDSFIKLKESFREEVVLAYPDQSREFFLEVDASDYGIGGVLSQVDDRTGHLRPVGFYSRKLQPAEQNYEIHDKELLAIVDALKEWRYLLIGTENPFSVFSDHKNLVYFSEPRNLNRRQARWSLFLSDFNFRIIYRPGSSQVVSDALSRHPKVGPCSLDESFNQQIVLPKDRFVKGSTKETLSDKGSVHTQDKFREKECDSDFCLPDLTDREKKRIRWKEPLVTEISAIETMDLISSVRNSDSESEEENSDYDLTREEYLPDSEIDSADSEVYGDLEQLMEVEDPQGNSDIPLFQILLQYLWYGDLPMVLSRRILNGIKNYARHFLFKDDRLYKKIFRNGHQYHVKYVPCSERKEIIRQYHQTLGHMQCATILPILEVRYYWPTMEEDIKNFQSSCSICQMNQAGVHYPRPLHPHEPVGIPFQKWGIDFVHDLPETDEGFKNVFSAKCYATKIVIFVKTKDRTARTAARCIFENIVCKYGTPQEIVSDRAPAFLDQVLQEYLKILEISHLPTSSYTPRSNGSVERVHRELKSILTKLCNGDVKKWDYFLSQAEFILNIRINNSTGYSPFFLAHGLEARIPGDEIPRIPPGGYDIHDEGDVAAWSAQELAALGQHRAAALQRLKAQAIRMKKQYDNKVGVSDFKFEFGDMVKLKNHSGGKMQSKYIGPFYIVDSGPNSTYFLQRLDGRRWTDQSGRDIPVNSEYLSYFSVSDDEFYPDHHT